MKLKYCLPAILLLLLAVYIQPLYTQKGQRFISVAIGEFCPDVMLQNIMHFPVLKSNISSFKGKLVIIDFWATTCGSCIKTLKELDSLQQQFGEQIQVFAVTEEPAAIAKTFLANNKMLKGLELPVITDDTVLTKLFPHIILPHEVWIDAKGMLRYITSSKAVTAANIRSILDGKQPVLPVKEDMLHYDANIPLLAYQNGGADTSFQYRSLLTNYIDGLPVDAGLVINPVSQTARVYCINYNLMALYHEAVPALNGLPANRIMINIKDTAKYFFKEGNEDWDEWKYKGMFCYDNSVPYKDSANLYEWMRQDLNKMFHLNGRMEKVVMKSLVLVRTNSNDNLLSKGGPSQQQLFDTGIKFIRNLPLTVLIHRMNTEAALLPVLDETNYNDPVDISFTADVTDIAQLRKELNAYGLDLIEAEKAVECFVLTDQ